MAAESGGAGKPPKSAKSPAKKPAKRTTAASAKAKSSTSRPKTTKGASAAKSPRTGSAAKGAAAKPAKGASAARSTKRPASASKATKPAGARSGKPAAAAAKPAAAAAKPAAAPAKPAVAAVKGTVAADPSAKRALVERAARSYFDALAARDVNAAGQVWREDAVDDIVPFGILRGRDAVKGYLRELFGAMPDARITVERMVADDRGAAVRWRAVGTFSGEPFQGLEPTGSRIDLRGIDDLEIEDGSIVHNTGVFDGAAFARQIGLLPPEDSGADRAIRAGFNTVTKLRRSVAKKTSR